MPLAILLALAVSLGIHAVLLFGTDIELFGGGPEPTPLIAELKPLPKAAQAGTPASTPPRPRHPKPPRLGAGHVQVAPVPAPIVAPPPVAEPSPPTDSDFAQNSRFSVTEPAPGPAQPLLPAQGTIRFAIFMGSQGFQIGRAEHHWEFTEDGRYRLTGTTETTGLVSVFKSIRFETESTGRLVAGGLQPERYRTRKNGKDANENADFAWATHQVSLSRDGSVRDIAPGTQDILSLNYQLAYLPHPENGASIGVVTGKKYERYALDSLGEEELDTPAGHFRALHLRAMTDSTTEIWLALDHHRLPVKIRFTDRKGDTYEQIATEIGLPPAERPL